MKKRLLAVVTAALLLVGCAGTGEKNAVSSDVTTRIPATENEAVTEGTENALEQESQLAEETQTEEETYKEPVLQTVKITAVGDCTLGPTQTHGYAQSFHEYYDTYGENYFFDGVRSVFENDDFTLINLECVLSNATKRVEKTWNLKGKPEYAGIMTGSSVEAASLGNNHTFDYGQQGLDETREVLDDAGIIFGYNDHVDTYTTDSGIVIGIVSANQLAADETHAAYIRDGIAKLREEGADLVIACCHWGIEGDHYPNDYQQKLAHQVIDWGADLLIGTHPHVLQGMELYQGKVICYSLGNFCFGGNRNPKDKDTAIYEQTFTFVDGVLQKDISADIIPCSISSSTDRNDFRPCIAEGDRKTQIIEHMNEYSKPYSRLGFAADGKLMIREEE